MADLPHRSGALRDRVSFQSRKLDENGAGLGEWQTIWSSRAAITDRFGGETVMAQRLQGQRPVTISIRGNPLSRNIENGWRAIDARDASRVFDLQVSAITPRGNWVDIPAIQQVGQTDNG